MAIRPFSQADLTSAMRWRRTNVTELQWPTHVVHGLLLKYPQVAVNARATLENRLRDAERRLMELSNEPVDRQIARSLVRLVRNRGLRLGDKIEVPFPVTRQDIADMTGTTLHTVSRTFGLWEKQGLIERGRQRVVVTDLEALARRGRNRGAAQLPPRRTRRRRGGRFAGAFS